MTLHTYTIPFDDGSAPNPFNGMCSLAICKPAIRRTARQGDWIAGLGSANAPSGDLSGRLVYAMQVEEVLTLRDYDALAPSRWPHRLPDIGSLDLSERLGDCIYDFSGPNVVQRRGVHGAANKDKDLRGRNVLLSKKFFYWGSKAIRLPRHLKPLVHQAQGHRSVSNAVLEPEFVKWLLGLGLQLGQMYGWPDYIIDWTGVRKAYGCLPRAEDDDPNDVDNPRGDDDPLGRTGP